MAIPISEKRERPHHLFVPNATVFIASLCVMVAELVAGRLVSRHLGQSLYTWTSCIGVFLAGISIGNYIGGRLADRFEPRRTLATLFVLTALSCLTVPLANRAVGEWTWLWSQSWPMRVFLHITATFVLPASMLGTISPVAAKMALAEGYATGRTIGQVYAWGAVGSIVGTYLTGFYLVAAMGAVATIVSVSVLLAVTGLLYAASSWFNRAAALAILGAALSLVWPGSAGNSLALALAFREPRGENVVLRDESRYSHIEVQTVFDNPSRRVMVLDRLTHSMIDLDRPQDLLYSYTWVFESATDLLRPSPEPLRGFVIGGGGFAFPTYLVTVRSNATVDVAEIDPAVTEAARRAFGLPDSPRLLVHDTDARHFVAEQLRRPEGAGRPQYDIIYGDSINDYAVPYHLTTLEFTRMIDALLKEDGLYLLNFIDSLESGRVMASLVRTVGQVFPHVSVLAVDGIRTERSTFVLIASKRPFDEAKLLATIQERHPFRGFLVTPEELAALRPNGILLTDDHAPMENLVTAFMTTKGEQADDYIDAGVRAAKEGHVRRARRMLEHAVELAPGSPPALYNFALALRDSGEGDKAIQYLEAAVNVDPDYVPAHSEAALWYARRGQMDAAIQHWLAVADVNPHDAAAMNNLGNAYLAQGHVQQAVDMLDKLEERCPDYPDGYHTMGIALTSLGRMDEAVASYEHALRLNPRLAETHYNLGMLLASRGDRDGAREHLLRASQLRPEMPQPHEALERLAAPMP